MKRAFVILTLLGLAFSPLMVSQAQAAPAWHHATVKHHKKHLEKKTKAPKRVAHRRHRKIAV